MLKMCIPILFSPTDLNRFKFADFGTPSEPAYSVVGDVRMPPLIESKQGLSGRVLKMSSPRHWDLRRRSVPASSTCPGF